MTTTETALSARVPELILDQIRRGTQLGSQVAAYRNGELIAPGAEGGGDGALTDDVWSGDEASGGVLSDDEPSGGGLSDDEPSGGGLSDDEPSSDDPFATAFHFG